MTMMTSHDNSSAKTAPRRNERMCAGCGKRAPAEELVRVIVDPDTGEVAVDMAGSAFGRGAHLHPSTDCIVRATKGGLARTFKMKVVLDAAGAAAAIVTGSDRRIEGLLSGARRAGQVAVGADAVALALREERAKIVVVARDAAAATKVPEIERAIAGGLAIAWSTKQGLGSLVATRKAEASEVAVIAVLQAGVASAIARTYRMAAPFASAHELSGREGARGAEIGEEVWSSSEVR